MAIAESTDASLTVPVGWWDALTDPPHHRFEIIRGEPVVTPSPNRGHQRAVLELAVILRATCPEGFEVLADMEWRLDRQGKVAQAPRPDLVVVAKTDGPITEPPLLAVEVLSPSDHHSLERHYPMSRIQGKQLDYAENGLRYYLEIAPHPDHLNAQLSELRQPGSDWTWNEIAYAEGDELLNTDVPFPFSFRPRDLI